jgi:hypothetical protein
LPAKLCFIKTVKNSDNLVIDSIIWLNPFSNAVIWFQVDCKSDYRSEAFRKKTEFVKIEKAKGDIVDLLVRR